MSSRTAVLAALGGSLLALSACAGGPHRTAQADPGPAFQNIGYATWGDDEPGYRLFPGDAVDVAVPSAPELNRSITVQPDGRVTLPLIAPVMVADRTGPQVEAALTAAYASQLNDPRVEINVKTATPLRIFVGGEVGKPGVYDMPGDIDALQAVLLGGGFLTSAEPHKVVVIRRGPGGRAMMRLVDLGEAVRHAPRADMVPLRRFDVVFVPRSGISNIGLWVQQYLRDTVPVQFSYATGSNGFLSTR